MTSALPMSRSEWKAALDALPSTPERIPAFFFGHGSPMLAMSAKGAGGSMKSVLNYAGPKGPLATFLQDFGPALLEKYKPKGIVVFSAHWDTTGQRLVTDYGDQNPLLMDYFGFDPEMYELEFNSRGDSALSQRVVDLFKEAGLKARTTSKVEQRGQDGRGFNGPGLDHGVFFPFRIMFGTEYRDIPIVQASIDGSLTPEGNWATGKAVTKLREEGILVLSGGLTVHNLRDFASFVPETANPLAKSFNDAVTVAISISDPKQRKEAMTALTRHPGFRASHPREDHFVPLYVAGGAGEEGDVRVLSALFGCQTVAFGL
ncbi:Extradiol ring-cleavage dioxygenase, class III enzyme, subunit B [Amylostereum chailletii]|nr:Extradiol ring-cleavage dioxygenase, class III enzyme, subunit B [Amylostereum chailletii]